jgi:hypothetical protein
LSKILGLLDSLKCSGGRGFAGWAQALLSSESLFCFELMPRSIFDLLISSHVALIGLRLDR